MSSQLQNVSLQTRLGSMKKWLNSSVESLSGSSHISGGVNLKWTKVPQSKDALLSRLQEMYWAGVKRELIHIILTLKAWQQADLQDVNLPDEEDTHIFGYDTFIDQVNESSRDFALAYGKAYALS
jgi:hypothetical protein